MDNNPNLRTMDNTPIGVVITVEFVLFILTLPRDIPELVI